MHEALIENWFRMIPWGDFWEPVTTKQKSVKWGIIYFLLLLGLSIFLINLDDLHAFAYACEHPIIVEAERKLVYTHEPYHDIYISYTYDGVQYEDIYYGYSKNPGIRWDGVKTLTVALDPNDPGTPVEYMYHATPAALGVVLWSLGLSMLIYGTLLEFPAFRAWRVRKANHPGFLSRPYGKPTAYSANPEYLTDFVVISVPIFVVHAILLMFIFPYTF